MQYGIYTHPLHIGRYFFFQLLLPEGQAYTLLLLSDVLLNLKKDLKI